MNHGIGKPLRQEVFSFWPERYALSRSLNPKFHAGLSAAGRTVRILKLDREHVWQFRTARKVTRSQKRLVVDTWTTVVNARVKFTSDHEIWLNGMERVGVHMDSSTCNNYKHMVSIDADATGLSVCSTTQDNIRRHDVSIMRDGVPYVNDTLSEHVQRHTCRSSDTPVMGLIGLVLLVNCEHLITCS